MKQVELLAPAGNFSKLKTAVHFGANAVYLGGKNFSLRSFADNFSEEEMAEAVSYAHERGVKVYVTVNIFAKDADLAPAAEYFRFLEKIGADAALVTDLGLFSLAREVAPNLPLHVSTQANTLNSRAVAFWAKQGASRIVLARELSLKEIAEIRKNIPEEVELEAFVHGAMCISYSGRCLLSNYLTGRDANRGECAQACRFGYTLTEEKSGAVLTAEEDGRGAYFLNSKDLNMIRYLKEMAESGVCSFKIEGRMKSEYYLASVVSAYRKAIDFYAAGGEILPASVEETLYKTAHREYTVAYALGENPATVNSVEGGTKGSATFIALVTGVKEGVCELEMRNRFRVGEELEVLSADPAADGAKFTVPSLFDGEGNPVTDAKLVMQKLYCRLPVLGVRVGDMLRRNS